MRPVSDAWAVSATMCLVDGAAGAPLCRMLGWDTPTRTSVAAAQLIELGRKHGQVRAWWVMCTIHVCRTYCQLPGISPRAPAWWRRSS